MLIAQIADTHVKAGGRLAYRRVDTLAGLSACVDHLNSLARPPDVVVMSGDLVDFGTIGDYAVARSALDRLAMPCYVIPGNHDGREAMREAFHDHVYLPRSEFLHYAIEDYPVRLIGLDTTVEGKPHGAFCERRVAWLADVLSQEPYKPTLVFMHHPPFLTGIEHMDVQNCREGWALGRLVEEHPQVKMILCGHVHRSIETLWHGALACIGPSPSHAIVHDLETGGPPTFVLEPPACRIVYLTEENRLVTDLSYIGAFDGPHPFFHPDGSLID